MISNIIHLVVNSREEGEGIGEGRERGEERERGERGDGRRGHTTKYLLILTTLLLPFCKHKIYLLLQSKILHIFNKHTSILQ
jgi:hypothetical protein